MPMPVLRFAPSPNGRLHLGHALSALINERLAQKLKGRLLLRIEDIDRQRCTPELEMRMIEDLDWLGIEFERPHLRQSENFDAYRHALDRLAARGLLYPAFLSRSEIRQAVMAEEARTGRPWPRDPDGAPLLPPIDRLRPESERRALIEAGHPFAWRLDMQAALAEAALPLAFEDLQVSRDGKKSLVEARPDLWGDVLLARRDTPTSYHLSVVVDDAAQGVTHVVRGQDLFPATAVHVLLQQLLGLPQPVYCHHPLVLGADGRKLSKSDGATALAELRAAGETPESIRARFAETISSVSGFVSAA
jgi:glutamyl-Q tRNA(Asp) synthetase